MGFAPRPIVPLTSLLPVLLALGAIALTGCTAAVTTGTGAPGPDAPQAAMTAQDLEAFMKQIGPTYQSLRKNLQGGDTDEAATEARHLAEWFGGVEKFWTQHERKDAAGWAAAARAHASEAAGAAAAGDAQKAAAAAGNMGGACKQCHGTYRESDGEGGYRIKPGVITP